MAPNRGWEEPWLEEALNRKGAVSEGKGEGQAEDLRTAWRRGGKSLQVQNSPFWQLLRTWELSFLLLGPLPLGEPTTKAHKAGKRKLEIGEEG